MKNLDKVNATLAKQAAQIKGLKFIMQKIIAFINLQSKQQKEFQTLIQVLL